MEKHYTIKEAAELLSLAEITIRQWIKNGKIKSIKIGSARRIPESSLLELVKEK